MKTITTILLLIPTFFCCSQELQIRTGTRQHLDSLPPPPNEVNLLEFVEEPTCDEILSECCQIAAEVINIHRAYADKNKKVLIVTILCMLIIGFLLGRFSKYKKNE
jgi:hypothetical protein